MENNFNNFGNNENKDNLENNMGVMQNAETAEERKDAEHSIPSSTGASGSVYSYSYVNQENQERNPNYYEKKEADSSSSRVYTAGSHENAQGSSQPGGYSAAPDSSHPGADSTAWDSSYPGAYNTAREGSQPGGYGTAQGNGQPGGFATAQGNSQPGGFATAQGTDGTDRSTAWNGSQGSSAGSAGQAAWAGQASSQNQEASGKKARRPKKQKMPGEKKQQGFGMAVGKCAALAVVFGLVSGTVFYGTGFAFRHTIGANEAVNEATAENKGNTGGTAVDKGSLSATSVSTATTVNDVSDVAENVMPSIVSITNMSQQVQSDFFGRLYQEEVPGAGSGIIIGQTEEEIYIATNNHVIANSTQLTVNFVDNQQVEGEVKGADASTDLAVVAIKGNDIPSDTMDKIKVATLGNSDSVKVGQSVVAIGNAMGYGQSVTTGVISAMDREVTVQDETTGTSITNDLIQTDAAINPGNSGGALLNMNGEVIGINSVKYADTQVEGMGYAIPISAAEPIVNNLITREIVDESKSAYLGVTGQDVTSEVSESFGMPEGLYITMVTENSAAEQAGINKGDVLTKFDGRKITSLEGLSDAMQYYEAGSDVEVTLQRNNNGEWREETITVTLGKKND